MESTAFPPANWSLYDDGADQRVWKRYGSVPRMVLASVRRVRQLELQRARQAG